MTIWGIHSDQPSLDLVGEGFVAIGWSEVGDLRQYEGSRDAPKDVLLNSYPEAKPGAIPVWAGVLSRFAFTMEIGDLVVLPVKSDATVSIGRVAGDYYYDTAADVHPHRRKVEWLRTGLPRTSFSQSARYEIGSAVTLFQVRNYAREFEAALTGHPGTPPVPVVAPPHGTTLPTAAQIETYTNDYVTDALLHLDPAEFETLVSELLKAMGYRARTTQYVGDGGVDVIAHRDPLGVEPPIIKVQCKRTSATIGGPEVQKLKGTLASQGELGVFVTLGNYSGDAIAIERSSQNLRLINGREFVEQLLAYFEQLSPEWKRRFSLRHLYVVDELAAEE